MARRTDLPLATPANTPAGRVYQFIESGETGLADRMRDMDEMFAAVTRLYPGHTWTRAEFAQLIFLDILAEQVGAILDRLPED